MKGQSSLEFIQAIGLLLVIFIILTPLAYIKYADNLNAQLRADGTLVADTVASEINTAEGVGRGYRRIFQLPPLLSDNSDYTVTIYPAEQRVYASWGAGLGASAPIATSKVTQTAPIGPGPNVVYNNNGAIEIGGQ